MIDVICDRLLGAYCIHTAEYVCITYFKLDSNWIIGLFLLGMYLAQLVKCYILPWGGD